MCVEPAILGCPVVLGFVYWDHRREKWARFTAVCGAGDSSAPAVLSPAVPAEDASPAPPPQIPSWESHTAALELEFGEPASVPPEGHC